jgi:hypothetical protein
VNIMQILALRHISFLFDVIASFPVCFNVKSTYLLRRETNEEKSIFAYKRICFNHF